MIVTIINEIKHAIQIPTKKDEQFIYTMLRYIFFNIIVVYKTRRMGILAKKLDLQLPKRSILFPRKNSRPIFLFAKTNLSTFFYQVSMLFFRWQLGEKKRGKKKFSYLFLVFPGYPDVMQNFSFKYCRERFPHTFQFLKMTHLKKIVGYDKNYSTRKKLIHAF